MGNNDIAVRLDSSLFSESLCPEITAPKNLSKIIRPHPHLPHANTNLFKDLQKKISLILMKF